MAARLTDRQKKKIIADYIELGSYNATAKANGVALNTVKKIVGGNAEIAEKCNQKKEENANDILAYMEERKDRVCEIIGIALEALPEKIIVAKTATEITTALGTLIDKWTALSKYQEDESESGVVMMPEVKEKAE